MKTRALTTVPALALIAAGFAARAGEVTDGMILKDAETPASILTCGLGLKGRRFSPLKRITKDSVKTLVPAWSVSFGGGKQRGQESQAVAHDGVIYITRFYSRLLAVDARTGEIVWVRPGLDGMAGICNGKESSETGKVNESWPGAQEGRLCKPGMPFR